MNRIAAGLELFCAALLALALAGCGTTNVFDRRPNPGDGPREKTQGSAPEAIPPAPVNLSGYSPSFRQGYADGCDSAGSLSQRRNENRYKTETDYMMGWNDGFSVCQRRR